MASNRYDVYNTPKGWAHKGNSNSKVSGYSPTQAEAYDRARETLRNNGGGEINIHGRNGQIRDKNTIAPGNDPRNIPG